MKKTISILICLLFAMTILYPVGVLITVFFGYKVTLISMPAFAVLIAVISVCITVVDLAFKDTLQNRVVCFLPAIITPLSLINTVFLIVGCNHFWERLVVLGTMLVAVVCGCILSVKHGKPLTAKLVSWVLSAIMIVPIGYLGFISLIFGSMRLDTVVQTLDSPTGKYYAQVVDSNQGALGGDTHVDVYARKVIDLFILKIEKQPRRVYSGKWGEYENMQIYWKDDDCLVINYVEYEIK